MYILMCRNVTEIKNIQTDRPTHMYGLKYAVWLNGHRVRSLIFSFTKVKCSRAKKVNYGIFTFIFFLFLSIKQYLCRQSYVNFILEWF